MKIAVTSFSSRSARNRARFSSIQVLAAKLSPASNSSALAEFVGQLGMGEPKFQHVHNVAGA